MAESPKEKIAKQLAQTLRSDLHLLSNEAKRKYPAVKEAAERGAMKLKNISEEKGFSLQVLATTDDVIHPLLFACESRNPTLVQIALSSLQKPVQYNAIPERSIQSIMATLKGLVEHNMEELKVLQTIMLLASATEVIKGKALTESLQICFRLYCSKDSNVHNAASVAIRQVVQALFDRLNLMAEKGGLNGPEPPPPDSSPSISVDHRKLPIQVRDAYLLFQDLCFLINGDPAAWLPPSLNLEPSLGLELLEIVLSGYPSVFAKERLFSVLLTERVCPLVIKLFSPSTKYRHNSPASGLIISDKPNFTLQIRLLRILRVLIKEYFVLLVTQCEIFLSMLVRFLDGDKPLWQRTLAVEVLHVFSKHPALLRALCECYDMQEHSTKVFNDIINGLGAFIQSSLTNPPTTVSTSSSGSISGHSSQGNSVSNSMRGQHVFMFGSVAIQGDFLLPSSHQKPLLLEMLDKQEVPSIPDGYPLVVAMDTLLECIKSISLIVNDQFSPLLVPHHTSTISSLLPLGSRSAKSVSEKMLSSSWTAILAALTLLLDAAVDDRTLKMVLEAYRLIIQLCGSTGLISPRDAFLTSLCKSSLPPRYAMSLVTQPRVRKSMEDKGKDATKISSQSRLSAHFDPSKKLSETSSRKRLNFGGEGEGGGGSVGGGGAGSSSPAISGQLTAKNVECILTLLYLIYQGGELLNSAWHLVLTTIQHVVFIVGMAPNKMDTARPNDTSTLALVNHEKKTELSEVREKLKDLFTNSKFLPEHSVQSLIKALCQLSDEAMQNPGVKEISLFPIASLREIGLSNLSRASIVWPSITTHLTMVCNHNDTTVRVFATESLTTLIRAILSYEAEQCQQESAPDPYLLTTFLQPLLIMSRTGHLDVRKKQLECIGHVLHSSGQVLHSSWKVVLEVISAASQLQSDSLVRAGFQSLQLVVADFLSFLPAVCLPFCLEVTGQYGLQGQDLNISLTSIGLLWNIADYLFQNRATLQPQLEALKEDDSPLTPTSLGPNRSTSTAKIQSSSFIQSLQHSTLPVFDSVWMLLFQRLADLCINQQSAIRKSAAQTLFSTISAHGGLLQPTTWQAVIWKVLFSVLDRVQSAVTSASSSTLTSVPSSSILVHHSRDTASKQWAETQVIVLMGVSRVIHSRLETLSQLDGFERAWGALMDTIRKTACSPSKEVALAAMKGFQNILDPPDPPRSSPRSSTINIHEQLNLTPTKLTTRRSPSPALTLDTMLWEKVWHTWCHIGREAISDRLPSADALQQFVSKSQTQESTDRFFKGRPTQEFLVHFLRLFPVILGKMRQTFSHQELQKACQILYSAVLVPIPKDVSPFLVPSVSEDNTSRVQRLVLECLSSVFTSEKVLEQNLSTDSSATVSILRKVELTDLSWILELHSDASFQLLVPHIFAELLHFAKLAWNPPELTSICLKSGMASVKLPASIVNVVPFAMSCLVLAVQLYRSCLSHDVPISISITELFLKALHEPLKSNLEHIHESVHITSLQALLIVLELSLPSVLENESSSEKFWKELGAILEDYLFSNVHTLDPRHEGVQSNGTVKQPEEYDVKVIEMIKDCILPYSSQVPRQFLEQLTVVLNRGSIHSATESADDFGSDSQPLRENFARACFQALLQLSFSHNDHSSGSDATSHFALTAILERSEEVLLRFVREERLSGSCPPSRSLMNEVGLVLKSTTVLISSLKQAQKGDSGAVSSTVWAHVSHLYPALVECVTCSNAEVRLALKDTLAQFSDMIVAKND